MKIKLIPVIEIGYNNQDVKLPKNGPYWACPEDWDTYHKESHRRAGFADEFIPFLPGSSFYELEKISTDNLKKIVIDRTAEMRRGAYNRDQASPLFGGYVLQIEGENLFYPQCCGDLADIQFWRNISNGKESYYEGHPAPTVKFENEEIVFDLTIDEFGEEFVPIPKKRKFRFKKEQLNRAIEQTEKQLKLFAHRIRAINDLEKLKIERIDDLLIWENMNYG